MATKTKQNSGSLKKGRSVGRQRKPQSAEIRKTLAGKFGARLLKLSQAAQLTAEELGNKIGKSEVSVNLYFSGSVVPPLNDWPRIAKALGVSVRDLLPE